ncbi:MAG: hypothetical protein CL917_06755 [Deltaproteobacteria bacterium]|nr:hypothetical protein [Deltaproteobacteria bacterium]
MKPFSNAAGTGSKREKSPLSPPSILFESQLKSLSAASTHGPIVDLACGRGRHALAAAQRGWPVIGLDRNRKFLKELQETSRSSNLPISPVFTDLETPFGIPLKKGSAGAVLVFRFLYRPLAQAIEALLAPGGLLLYETFTTAQAQRATGPSNPSFLLKPGELKKLFPTLETLHYSEAPDMEKIRGPHESPGDESQDETWARLVARKRP